jgi:hypothetical protein
VHIESCESPRERVLRGQEFIVGGDGDIIIREDDGEDNLRDDVEGDDDDDDDADADVRNDE